VFLNNAAGNAPHPAVKIIKGFGFGAGYIKKEENGQR
jgi:hypothetical protein